MRMTYRKSRIGTITPLGHGAVFPDAGRAEDDSRSVSTNRKILSRQALALAAIELHRRMLNLTHRISARV